ncbi:MAG: N-acetylmuramoyl-L-alanine amidase [bacterium]|nr:N-acetylmuramoyl-L-alanine amidase [bacterium]
MKDSPLVCRRALHALTLLVLCAGLCVTGVMTAGLLRAEPDAPASEPAPTGAPSQSPLPLSGLTVALDPGHGGYDGGARCRDSGVWEKALNLEVAQRLEASLAKLGAQVVMTRRTDTDLCGPEQSATKTKKRQDMERRVAIASEAGADMVLSIHMNEYRSRRESGPQVFYREGSAPSRLLAGCLQDALIGELSPARRRSAMAGDYFILQLDVPSCLVECGFISNAEEERLLLDASYQQRLADAVAQGVLEYVTLARRLREAPQQTPPAAAR